jgi:hypothetical protein
VVEIPEDVNSDGVLVASAGTDEEASPGVGGGFDGAECEGEVEDCTADVEDSFLHSEVMKPFISDNEKEPTVNWTSRRRTLHVVHLTLYKLTVFKLCATKPLNRGRERRQCRERGRCG